MQIDNFKNAKIKLALDSGRVAYTYMRNVIKKTCS